MHRATLPLLLTLLLALAGCAGVQPDDARRRAYVNDNPGLPLHLRRTILAGETRAGMTPEQVRAVYGDPSTVRRSGDDAWPIELWTWHIETYWGASKRYGRFENGRLERLWVAPR